MVTFAADDWIGESRLVRHRGRRRTGLGRPSPQANNLFQGMSQDLVTGLYDERARWYSPSLGTWISQDPAGYINGADTYQFLTGSPLGETDPSGFTGGALGSYIYWQTAANRLQAAERYYPTSSSAYSLLNGIQFAAYTKAMEAYNQAYQQLGQSPWSYLETLHGILEKAEKGTSVTKYCLAPELLEKVEHTLKDLNLMISAVQAGRGLGSGNAIAQMKGIGDALNGLGSLLPADLGGPLVSQYGQILSGAATAVGETYNALGGGPGQPGNNAFSYWTSPPGVEAPSGQGPAFPYNYGSENENIPFTPAWANQVMQQTGLHPYPTPGVVPFLNEYTARQR